MRFVQVFTQNQLWDNHNSIRSRLPASCKKVDQPAAALVKDLKRRGLLDSTIVHWGGEMGRLPVIQNDTGEAKVGRDHNTYGFSMWVAGGGFRGGYAHGATDEFGHEAVENIVNHYDYHATLLHSVRSRRRAACLPAERPTAHPARRPGWPHRPTISFPSRSRLCSHKPSSINAPPPRRHMPIASSTNETEIHRAASPPKAAYIHVPFCRHRCGYCNFTLVAGRDDLIEAYLEALARELSWLEEPRPVDTLFFGGGTPTQLSADQLTRLFAIVDRWHPRSADCEMSVEANPADIDAAKVDILEAAGVNRLSFGVQSFNDDKLALLERDHRRRDIERAWALARPHFSSLALDLIFSTPGETASAWRSDLSEALALAPNHVSTYGLTFERGTSFGSRLQKGELVEVDEELQREMYLAAIDTLIAAGLAHYEVSNFARPGHRCRHNEAYWLGESYYAAGPGAARYVAGRRETNHRSTTTWLKRVMTGQSPVAESECLVAEDVARERLVFGLRRLDGIDCETFVRQTGYKIESLAGAAVSQFIALGLLEESSAHLRLTRAGLLVSDSLWPELLG